MPPLGKVEMTTYFKIVIDPVEGKPDTYEVTAEVPSSDKEGTERVNFDQKVLLEPVRAIRNTGGLTNFAEHDEKCRKVGHTIYRTFLTGAVLDIYQNFEKTLFASGGDFVLKLYLPPDLHWIPWELLRKSLSGKDEKSYLCRYSSVVRYIHDKEAVIRDGTVTTGMPLKLLYVYCSPDNSVKVANPELKFENEKVELYPEEPLRSYEKFRDEMANCPDGFLFYGHAEREKDAEGTAGIFLFESGEKKTKNDRKPDRIRASQIGDLTRSWKTKLAILSACDTASFLPGEPFEQGIPDAIIRHGWPAYVIAYQNKIDQDAAREFVSQLVQFLGKKPLWECLELGRKAIIDLEGNSDVFARKRASRDWWLPIIYASTENPDITPVAVSPLPQGRMAAREEEDLVAIKAVGTVVDLVFNFGGKAYSRIFQPSQKVLYKEGEKKNVNIL